MSTALSQRLNQFLSSQHARLQQLTDLLNQEQELLGVGSIDGKALETIAKAKAEHFAALQENEQQRRTLQTGQGLGESREGAAKLAQIAGCSDVWQQVLELAREVSRQNQLNGELIQHRLQHNQQMLNIIREAAGTPLYGADGKSTSGGSRINSKA
ncbi:flagella synthesis protein FlgN [Aliidiomarina haloalkalitolerans]|uniref:Flagellar protein FlgN n=1 Tax=Aliidiomarina haloalkalitolerans TaxID=859059 RepID=A0A432VS78_9GAMM|nr:flagellar protein FlgN [Aliidiomarina haloalkalitolerans]MCL4410809.1 flagellar protein FlgN [Gammaproteobacteria bacterium]RUO19215.1 flagellar protein FlgN [Aliidiomarina haloalkalitolerans]